MTGAENKIKLESALFLGFVITLLLSFVLISIFSSGKDTLYSAYVKDENSKNIQWRQLDIMASDLSSSTPRYLDQGYNVANTMSTPMLVNDWKEPHRTMLLIVAPEKPITVTEADAVYDFVTNKGGKVIVASNNSNAQVVAEKFGVQYKDATGGLLDGQNYYSVKNLSSGKISENQDQQNIWALASVQKEVQEKNRGCNAEQSAQYEEGINSCVMPIMFDMPTAIQVLTSGEGESEDQSSKDYVERNIHILASASPAAFLDNAGDRNIDSPENQILGPGENGLIVRIDYPNQKAIDMPELGTYEEVDVTGSIVFVAGQSAFANYLWNSNEAEETGRTSFCLHLGIDSRPCWTSQIKSGPSDWQGNSAYFQTLIFDMMEFDNQDLSNVITSQPSQFNIVFDESRHSSSPIVEPFSAAMSTIVLLTSDTWLKWLILLNMIALLAISVMVVPDKENWRHVFDLTRFRERPKKVKADDYHRRIKEALMSKVRLFHDLTRDEMAMKTPAEVQSMIKEPRLVELAFSRNRTYTPDELRELMRTIRRWDK
ncbi:MAG: hypothetical protein CMB56_001895 [Methanobacteriota archaeon]|nr:MAG: hypothetical protein CMB56_001895 [Euryarchaeota archaeon]|tara:strand:- start:149 stop:1777 length:1629 start_codon:yes stop_codon:yes gene_type:complete